MLPILPCISGQPVRSVVLGALLSFGLLLSPGAWAQPATEIAELTQGLRAKQYQRVLERTDALLLQTPRDAQFRFLRALALTELGRQDEAIEALRGLTEDYPELPEPYNNLAVLYAARGQFDEAQRALQTAVHNLPGFATAHENLGDLYLRLAALSYERAAKLERGARSAADKLAKLTPLSPTIVGQARLAARAEADLPTGKELPVRTAAECPPLEAAKPVAPAAPVAAKPDPKPAAPKMPPEQLATESHAVLAALQSWAKAWSSKNADAYMGHYAPEFAPANGESRPAWEAMRRDRIAKPKVIQVEAQNPKVTFSDIATAKVSFLQSYKASTLVVATPKTLTFSKNSGRWLIVAEEGGN